MKRIFSAGVAWILVSSLSLAADPGRPNFLWISCEDMGPHLGCYGVAQATTPHLDRLAAEAVRYTHAFSVAPVCAPSRTSIITGMYATSLGNQFMRCQIDLPADVRLFPDDLRQAGYYCTNNSKTDYNLRGDPQRCWDECSPQAHWRRRPDRSQPFFAVFNLTITHESQIFGYRRRANVSDDQLHDPARMELPPYYPDTPVTRLDWAHYFDNITAMDQQAGEILAQLASDGLAENTIVFFWSDHGVGLPRAKRWLYDSGTHVPLLVRVPPPFRQPQQAEPGSVDAQLISLLDLAPTVLHLAGLPMPQQFQGRAFLGDSLSAPRQWVHMIRDRMDERYDTIRAVRDSRYRYIRNYQPFLPYAQVLNYMEQEHTMQELRRLNALGQLTAPAAAFMAPRKPVEELYDLQQDPHEIHNLIDRAPQQPELQAVLERLRDAHRRWVFETRDTGLIPEADLELRGRQVGSRLQVLRQPGADDLLQRLLSVNALSCDAAGSTAELAAAYRDSDPAVRYWAIRGIADHPQDTPETRRVIEAALADEAATVQVTAARAAWRLGMIAAALPVLERTARSDQEFVSLMALHVIDEMDEAAAPLANVVDWVLAHGQPYPQRVATLLRANAAR